MDDLAIYSRTLDQTEVKNLMNCSPDTQNLDPNMVMYYNFDVQCDLSDFDSCDIIGDKMVKNYGSAGSNYDLISGGLNNDAGFGNSWLDETGKEFDFGDALFVRSTVPASSAGASEQTPATDSPLVPRVYHVLPGNTASMNTPTGCANPTLVSVPATGVVKDAASSVSATVNSLLNQDDSDGFLFIADASMATPLSFHISCSIDNELQEFEYHVWPVKKPSTLSQLEPLIGLEDVDLKIFLIYSSISYSDSAVGMKLITPPTSGTLSYGPLGPDSMLVQPGEVVPSAGTLFIYTPPPGMC